MDNPRRITVTEAARNFSDLVNRVYYLGESTILIRNGIPVARLGPPTPVTSPAFELAKLWRSLPHLDPTDAGRLAEQLEEARRGAFVEGVLESFPIVPYGLRDSRRHAELWAELARRGEPIGAYDMLVAATALANDFRLATLNVREFERVPGLSLQPIEAFRRA